MTALLLLLAQVAGSQTAKEPEWSTVNVAVEPTARHEAGMVAVHGKGYLMGGRGIKPVEEFDPATGVWRRLRPTPLEIHHFQPTAVGGLVYVMTAMTGEYPSETPLDRWLVFDPREDRWQAGGPIPEGRRRGAGGTAVHDGKLYVAGGIVNGHTSGTVAWFDELDPDTGQWRALPEAPRPRDHCSAAVSDGKLFLVGGRNTSHHEPGAFTAFFGAVIPEVDVYDFASGEWSTLRQPLAVPTTAGGLVALNGWIYYFGGESAERFAHSETHRIDPRTGAVGLTASLNRGRHGGGVAVIGGKAYIAAGSGGGGGGPELSSTEVFRPDRRALGARGNLRDQAAGRQHTPASRRTPATTLASFPSQELTSWHSGLWVTMEPERATFVAANIGHLRVPYRLRQV